MEPLTHELLAQYVGTSRELVTCRMTKFRRQGYLEYSRKDITLHRDVLQAWVRDAN
jgi:CRP/FNR family cyclic AMP-dependent transcriptional regulator